MDRTASLRANAGQFATTWGNDLSAAPENSRPRLSPQLGWTGRRIGAGDGNRTHVSSLGSCSSTIELHPPDRDSPSDTYTFRVTGNSTATCGVGQLRTIER